MAVHKLYRNSDLCMHLDLQDAKSKSYRIKDTVKFVMRLFTTDEKNYVEASYIGGEAVNLEFGKAHDHVTVPARELAKLADGPLYYSYEVTVIDKRQDDYLYTETIQGQTEIILKTRIAHVK